MEAGNKQFLLDLARQSILARLERRSLKAPPPDSKALKEPCGAFVTLKIAGNLRGCIGNIRAKRPLYETIRKMAVAAATEDPRFPPVSRRELDEVHIEISVLSTLEKVADVDTIQIGRHGLYMTRGANSGLLLPQVAVEWEWDRPALLEHTCLKAGLPRDAWKQAGTEIFSFTAVVFGEEK